MPVKQACPFRIVGTSLARCLYREFREVYLQGATALHLACQVSHYSVVEVLLEHGAPLMFDANSACKVCFLPCLAIRNQPWLLDA